MSRTLSWRKVLALPVVLSLSLGGALLVAAPATAAPEDLTVTSPTVDTVLDSRVVDFVGTGTTGSTITIVDAEGTAAPGTTPVVVVDGAWTTTATYTDDAALAQTVTVEQTTEDAPDGEETVSFTLPAVIVPVAEFEITSPAADSAFDGAVVTVEGTGADGHSVSLQDADGVALGEPNTVANGTWSIPVTFAAGADAAQTVTATEISGDETTGTDTVSFTITPEEVPVEEAEFAITSPTDEATLTTRTVVFEGTGTDGSTVDLFDALGDPLAGAQSATVVDGEWTITVAFTDEAEFIQVIDAVQTTEGQENGLATVVVILPFAYDPPVITSPTNDETVVGDQVTFEGTGQPGAYVALLIVPTSLIEEVVEGLEGALGEQRLAAAAAEPADPTDPILVDENGEWTVTLALFPEDYTAFAALIDSPETGFPVSFPVSDVSELVEFSLVAAAAPVANPVPGAGDGEGLAVTGSESTGFVGLAAGLLLMGVIALAARTRTLRATRAE